jgi:hypothetical protein
MIVWVSVVASMSHKEQSEINSSCKWYSAESDYVGAWKTEEFCSRTSWDPGYLNMCIRVSWIQILLNIKLAEVIHPASAVLCHGASHKWLCSDQLTWDSWIHAWPWLLGWTDLQQKFRDNLWFDLPLVNNHRGHTSLYFVWRRALKKHLLLLSWITKMGQKFIIFLWVDIHGIYYIVKNGNQIWGSVLIIKHTVSN